MGEAARGTVRIRTRHLEGSKVVAVRVWLRGGARNEAIPGQALITGRMLAEGTRERDWRTLAEEAETKGINMSSYGAFEIVGISMEARAGEWRPALERAAEMTREACFPTERCDWLKQRAAAELRSLRDQAEVLTGWAFLEQLYDPHPRARPLQGTVDSLALLSAEDCRSFGRWCLGQGVIVAVAGGIDEGPVRSLAEELFAGEVDVSVGFGAPPAPVGLSIPRREIDTMVGAPAHVFGGHLTVPIEDPDLPALQLLSVILGKGAGLTGRFPTRLREQEGLAYSVATDLVAGSGLDRGRFVVYCGTAVENRSRVEDSIQEEIERLLEDGVGDDEVEEARSYLLGREPFDRETAGQVAELLAASELYGQPLYRPGWLVGRWLGLDRGAVEMAARRHIDPSKLRFTVGVPGEVSSPPKDGGGFRSPASNRGLR